MELRSGSHRGELHDVVVLDRAETIAVDGKGPDQVRVGHMASSKHGSSATEFRKYQMDEADVETEADEVARLMREVAEMKASAEEVPLKVLFEGCDHTSENGFEVSRLS